MFTKDKIHMMCQNSINMQTALTPLWCVCCAPGKGDVLSHYFGGFIALAVVIAQRQLSLIVQGRHQDFNPTKAKI
jgi:hypothetical protein